MSSILPKYGLMGTFSEEYRALYDYVDSLPLSRAKKNIARDFADGVLAAEMVHHEQPYIVELHNYSSACSIPHKMYNWDTLNQKVFRHHLQFSIPKVELQAICSCKAGAVEKVLILLRQKLAEYKKLQLEDSGFESPCKRTTKLTSPTFKLTSQKGKACISEENVDTPTSPKILSDLRDANQILNLKIEKLEQLVQLKDAKIRALSQQLTESPPQAT